jgi:hypothetical protein
MLGEEEEKDEERDLLLFPTMQGRPRSPTLTFFVFVLHASEFDYSSM